MKENECLILIGKNISRIRKEQLITIKDLGFRCDIEKSNLIPHIDLTVHVKSNEVIPPLSVLDLKNRGESMKEDKLVSLMDGVVY
jgi:hypothetical protein